jgi:topoisomerase-4 subunit A
MVYRKQGGQAKDPEKVILSEFITVKGISAKGNQLTTDTLNKIVGLDPLPEPEPETAVEVSEPVLDGPIVEDTPPAAAPPPPKPFEGEDEPPQITLDF